MKIIDVGPYGDKDYAFSEAWKKESSNYDGPSKEHQAKYGTISS